MTVVGSAASAKTEADANTRTHWPPRSSVYVIGDDRPVLRVDILLIGEPKWASNKVRFLDEGEALAFADGLCDRWTIIDKIRVVPEAWPVAEEYAEGSETARFGGGASWRRA
jgi:hypothetical protein